MWGGFVIFLKKKQLKMLWFLSHYHCYQNNSQTLLGFLWLSRLRCILHDKVDKNLTRNFCCMRFPPLVLSPPASLHSLLGPHKAEIPQYHLLNIADVEYSQWPGTGCSQNWLLFIWWLLSSSVFLKFWSPCQLSTFLEGCARRLNSFNGSNISLELCRMDIKCPHSFKS